MSPPPARPPLTTPAEGLPTDRVRRAAVLVWPNLPLLLVGSVLAVLPFAAGRWLAPVLDVPAVTVLALGLLAPVAFAPLLRSGLVLLTGDHVGVRELLSTAPAAAGRTLPIAAPAAIAAALTTLALSGWTARHQTWWLASAGAGACVTVVLVAAAVVAWPYRLQHGAGIRESWLVGGFAATRSPVPVLAVLAAVGLVLAALPVVSLALALLAFGPLALIWAAAATQSLDRARARLP